jgi:selenocysteine lyase/cysteine desulfurase
MQPDALSTAARPHFPALTTHHPTFTFGDNAGGSQILGSAVDAMTDYLLRTNVQMGSDYMPASTRRCLDEAQRHAAEMFGPEVTPAEVVFGASSTQNLENLARGLEGDVGEGDEFIVTEEHEGETIRTRSWIPFFKESR